MYREVLMKKVYEDDVTRKQFENSCMFKNVITELGINDEDTDKQF